MSTEPKSTQTAYPWRATVRTVFAAVVGLCASWVTIVAAAGVDPGIPWVATSIAVTGAVTRILAVPAVVAWMERFVPWLSPAPQAEEVTANFTDDDPEEAPDVS